VAHWYQKIIPGKSDTKAIQALQDKLDTIVGEVEDLGNYEAKFYDAEPSTGGSGGMFEMAGVDQVVNNAVLQRLFVSETWVYTAVMAIAKTIAGLPMKGEKKGTVSRTELNEVTGQTVKVEQESWTDASGEKIFTPFKSPNAYTSREEFLMLITIDLLTCGEYFIWLDSDDDLTTVTDATGGDANSPFARLRGAMASKTPIKGMYRIPPQLMKPMPSETGLGIEVYAMESDKGTFAFNPAEIIHVKLPNPCNPYQGLSPLIPAFKPVLLDRFSTEHIIRFYKSGARLGGVIETTKNLNKEQLGRFQRSFENNYTGRQNHHRTLILPSGMEYKPIEANPAETALLDFCKYNRDAILSVYNVPPIKVGVMDNANYANALVQLKVFFEDTIKPLLGFIEGGFNMKPAVFPDQFNFRIKFDLSQVEALKDNFKEKADAAKSMLEGGLNVNEVRKQVWGAVSSYL
jgi:phage portal protein BeeE